MKRIAVIAAAAATALLLAACAAHHPPAPFTAFDGDEWNGWLRAQDRTATLVLVRADGGDSIVVTRIADRPDRDEASGDYRDLLRVRNGSVSPDSVLGRINVRTPRRVHERTTADEFLGPARYLWRRGGETVGSLTLEASGERDRVIGLVDHYAFEITGLRERDYQVVRDPEGIACLSWHGSWENRSAPVRVRFRSGLSAEQREVVATSLLISGRIASIYHMAGSEVSQQLRMMERRETMDAYRGGRSSPRIRP